MSLIFNFPVNKQDPEQGKILLSEPFLGDRFFKRSVVLLGEHNDKGTIGFILNKPTNIKISEAIEDFPEFNAPIYFGGPVLEKQVRLEGRCEKLSTAESEDYFHSRPRESQLGAWASKQSDV